MRNNNISDFETLARNCSSYPYKNRLDADNIISLSPFAPENLVFVRIQSINQSINQAQLIFWNSIVARKSIILNSTYVPKDMVLSPISFRCCRIVGPGKDLSRFWPVVGSSSGLSP